MSYRTIIGLEVHVQLLTRTKLFCGCATTFGLPPNSATCAVCCGLPGTLPVMNRTAFQLALKAAVALNCTIATFTKWDRKNYYYPDLPKNYQISQYDLPFSSEGWLEIETPAGARKIGIIRAHLEEDAGKMLHDERAGKNDSLVDLNRTGTPLLEIVSHPDMETAEEAKAYLEELRLLLREIGVSDCEMQEGSLRCDANINLHVPQPDGSFVATPIIEVKNLNTFRGVERSLKYESERQAAELQRNLDAGVWHVDATRTSKFRDYRVSPITQRKSDGALGPVSKATAGWDERTGRTEIQRRKEEASDYCYFPEPDLVPVTVDADTLERVRAELGELPAAQKTRLQSQYGLPVYDAGVLSRQGRAFVAYFEAVVKQCGDAKEACNWTMNDLLSTLNDRKLDIKESSLSPENLGELISEIQATGLNKQRAREVYAVMLDGLTAKQAIDKLGFKVVADEGQLLELVRKAIAANPKAVADFKKGKVKAADAIKGFVMRETKGMAKTEMVQQLVMRELAKE
ncbi:MAG: Asp-tRNA(Asn)/Glu-tRNA(Gln) amidotransferase subunit GatB [Gemmataceae bacterium]|nr:Asp-tRNA(Asn)/Glu-tRNA(Gln) amidotransferase subunit GatB [Gemmataceae bacterium]